MIDINRIIEGDYDVLLVFSIRFEILEPIFISRKYYESLSVKSGGDVTFKAPENRTIHIPSPGLYSVQFIMNGNPVNLTVPEI